MTDASHPQHNDYASMVKGEITGWWWPYIHETVIALTVLVTALSIILGSLAGGISATNPVEGDWIDWLPSVNLNYDFMWAELTAGEGSLFWNVAVNGYDYEARNIAKFPLYPGIVKGVWGLTGHSVSITFLFWLIHQIMVWAGIAETYRFWENYHRGYGFRAVMWLLSSPLITLHVWLFDFIEPGFIALLWVGLSLERKRHWAASSTALLGLTMLQPSGIILAFFIGVRRLWRWNHNDVPCSALFWASLPGIMWLLWMGMTSTHFHQPFAPYTFQADWGRDVFRWPWIRWAEYIKDAIEVHFYWSHLIQSISLTWITLGYLWGGKLWLGLTPEQKYLLGGSWAMPLFSFLIVVIPLSTALYGANRYAATTLLGVWPLLCQNQLQAHHNFQRYERLLWLLFLGVNFIVSFTIITDYGKAWGVYYWP